jgi:hypothetical protein
MGVGEKKLTGANLEVRVREWGRMKQRQRIK